MVRRQSSILFALHQVLGVVFDDRLVPPRAKTEAVAINGNSVNIDLIKRDRAPLLLPSRSMVRVYFNHPRPFQESVARVDLSIRI